MGHLPVAVYTAFPWLTSSTERTLMLGAPLELWLPLLSEPLPSPERSAPGVLSYWIFVRWLNPPHVPETKQNWVHTPLLLFNLLCGLKQSPHQQDGEQRGLISM